MKWVSIVAGAILIVAALRDLFSTLFHPGTSGTISDWIALSFWRAYRKFFPQRLVHAGPLIFLAVIGYWGLSMIFGFALIYRPFMPNTFVFMRRLDPASFDSFFAAINFSVGTLITEFIGATPTNGFLQFLTTLEAIFGFAILTASISWILSIYPVIEHRRSLAHQASLFHHGEETGYRRLEALTDTELHTILLGLASQLTTHRNELSQFPITYFFQEPERQTAIGGILFYISELADRFVDREGAVHIAAVTLGGAVDDYLSLIDEQFFRRKFDSRETSLHRLAADHRRKPVHSPPKYDAPVRAA